MCRIRQIEKSLKIVNVSILKLSIIVHNLAVPGMGVIYVSIYVLLYVIASTTQKKITLQKRKESKM